MSGKKKLLGKQYSENWGGNRPPSPKVRGDLVTLKGEKVRLIKRIGGGDFHKGLDSVLKGWEHF